MPVGHNPQPGDERGVDGGARGGVLAHGARAGFGHEEVGEPETAMAVGSFSPETSEALTATQEDVVADARIDRQGAGRGHGDRRQSSEQQRPSQSGTQKNPSSLDSPFPGVLTCSSSCLTGFRSSVNRCYELDDHT